MNSVLVPAPEKLSAATQGLHFIFHASFEDPGAETAFGANRGDGDEPLGYMPDDVTRDLAKRMHYAAWRLGEAETQPEKARWRRRYFECRDRMVLGNRKLTYRAANKW